MKKHKDKRDIIKAWVNAFNRADADAIANFYHGDAINDQVALSPVKGKENIKQMFAGEFAAAKMTCIIENIYEDGAWVILEWSDPNSLRGCGFFHIVDDKIKFQRGYWDRLSFIELQKQNP